MFFAIFSDTFEQQRHNFRWGLKINMEVMICVAICSGVVYYTGLCLQRLNKFTRKVV
jgi:hypothetical protein